MGGAHAGGSWPGQHLPEPFTGPSGPGLPAGPGYLRVQDLEWTRRATAHFTDTARSLCRVALSLGTGCGAWMMTWRYDTAVAEADEALLRTLAAAPGVVGVRLCVADRAASGIETEEKKGRPRNAVPGFVLLVEGGSDREQLEAACARVSIPDAQRGLYRLQYLLRK